MSERISHWIDGRLSPGTSGRTAPVYNPATGEQTGRGRPRLARPRSTPPSPPPEAAARVALVLAVAPLRPCCSRSGSCCTTRTDELAAIITAEHGKVLSDAHGEIARGLENVEFAARCPAAAQGRLLRAGGDRRRRLLDPPAARRGRRHHAVQLPGHGAAVDVRQRHRLRQRLHPQAEREGPLGRRCSWPSCGSRPGCPTASSPWCRATRRRSTRSWTTRTSPR